MSGTGNVSEPLVRTYSVEDQRAVIDLWDRCGLLRPWNEPVKDIGRKLRVNSDKVVGSVMIGYEGHRGRINYLAVDPSLRRQGIGRRLMEQAEEILRKAGCPKINLQVRSENKQAADFYADLGYLRDNVISFGKCLGPD